MIRKKSAKIPSQKYILSKKTISLINWLIEHDQESLKKLLAKAYHNGALINKNNDPLDDDEAQYIFFRLVGLIEILSEEIAEEHDVSHICNRSLLPKIKHIDNTEFDQAVIEDTASKALHRAKEQNSRPENILFEELLKKWKPQKKLLQ